MNRRAVIARCRARAIEASYKLNLDIAEDLSEIPVVFDDTNRVRTTCGYFQHITTDGLGRIIIHTKMMRDEAYLETTLMHEYAHALVHYFRNGRCEQDSHGKDFQYVMRLMGQEPSKYVCGPSDKPPESVFEKA